MTVRLQIELICGGARQSLCKFSAVKFSTKFFVFWKIPFWAFYPTASVCSQWSEDSVALVFNLFYNNIHNSHRKTPFIFAKTSQGQCKGRLISAFPKAPFSRWSLSLEKSFVSWEESMLDFSGTEQPSLTMGVTWERTGRLSSSWQKHRSPWQTLVRFPN